MDEQKIIQSFRDYLTGKGLNEKSLSLSILPELFINYYRDITFSEVDRESDGDMLLFQYGTYNWGEGKYFEINFTRQFYEVFEEDDEEYHEISQFGVTFFYLPEKFKDISAFNKYFRIDEDSEKFKNTVINSPGYKQALEEIPVKEEIEFTLV